MCETFSGLRNDDYFSDVTLANSDGEQIESQKVILSSGSNFLRNTLNVGDSFDIESVFLLLPHRVLS